MARFIWLKSKKIQLAIENYIIIIIDNEVIESAIHWLRTFDYGMKVKET